MSAAMDSWVVGRANDCSCPQYEGVIYVYIVPATRDALTIFDPYSILSDDDISSSAALEAKGFEIVILPVAGRSLELLIARAQRSGPVLMVVADDGDAEAALRAGADEVLFRGRLEAAAISAAIRRALARREGLVRRDLRTANDKHVLAASTLEILVGGACVHVEGALEKAVERCDTLRQVVRQGIESELGAPKKKLRSPGKKRPVQGRAGRSDIMANSVNEVFTSLDEALQTCGRVRSMVLPGTSSYLDLREVVLELTALVRPAIETVAEFVVRVPEQSCVVRVARWQAVQAIGGLLTNAVGATRERGGERYIELRMVREHRDVAVEVVDDGVGMSESQIQGILQGVSRDVVNPSLVRFAFAAAIARHASGELLLTSSPNAGTTARMYLGLHEPRRPRARQ